MNFNPKAPPVYRPNSQKILGPPAVYRPQQAANAGLQPKVGSNFRLETRPAPPAYRPQQQPGVQPKPVNNFRTEMRPAPPIYRPQQAAAPGVQLNPGNCRRETPSAPPVYRSTMPGSEAQKNVPTPVRAPAPLQQPLGTKISFSIQRFLQTGVVQRTSMSEDEVSDLSEDSLDDSEDEFKKLRGRSKNVIKRYRDNKGRDDLGPINTSEGLSEIVSTFDTAKQSAANTTALLKGPNTDDIYALFQMGTALAVKLKGMRYNFDVSSETVQQRWGKKTGVHTEMHILHVLTGGVEEGIAGCLQGHTLVVDKPVCADCYRYILRADPDEVRDGTDFWNKHVVREKWDTWSNPFKL